jgi:hypothetical protein
LQKCIPLSQSAAFPNRATERIFEQRSKPRAQNPEETSMPVIQKTNPKPAAELEGIPPELRWTNGAAKPDVEALLARIAQLEAQVARKSTLTLKVSEKGAVSLHGMGRFPVTLFGQQLAESLGYGR